jgi:hypothetical protein
MVLILSLSKDEDHSRAEPPYGAATTVSWPV